MRRATRDQLAERAERASDAERAWSLYARETARGNAGSVVFAWDNGEHVVIYGAARHDGGAVVMFDADGLPWGACGAMRWLDQIATTMLGYDYGIARRNVYAAWNAAHEVAS